MPIQPQTMMVRICTTFVKESRTLVIIFISIFTLYVQIIASSTKNWDSTRKLGFAQPNYCASVTASYNVGEYDINSADDSYSEPKPLLNKSPNSICFSQSFFVGCISAMGHTDTGGSIEAFTNLFNRPDRNYFPYATFTNAIGFISLLLTVLYESSDQHFVAAADGSFSVVDKRLIVRINHLICAALVIMLLVSASYQLFMYEEVCSSLYKKQGTNAAYCDTISSCGMTVSSVISPTDALAANYSTINIVFAILLTIAMIFRCMTHNPSVPRRILPHTLEDTDDDLNAQLAALGASRNLRVRLELDLALLRGANNSGGSTAVVTNVQTVREPNWKEYTLEDHERSEGVGGNEEALECPICLSSIHLRPAMSLSQLSSRNNNNNNNRNQSSSGALTNRSGGGGILGTARSFVNRTRSGFSLISTASTADEVVAYHLDNSERGEAGGGGGGATARSDARDANEASVVENMEEETSPRRVVAGLRSVTSSSNQLRKIVKAQCNHIFHELCIQEWFRNHDTCPVCRTSLHYQH